MKERVNRVLNKIRSVDLQKIPETMRPGAEQWLGRKLWMSLPKSRLIRFALLLCLLAAIYWGVIASDRYVSESHVVIKRVDLPGGGGQTQSFDLSSLISGSSANKPEQMLLRDHLLSVDMLMTLDAKLNLRAHYADWRRDPISQMWFEDTPMEMFYRYYLSRVSVEYDENSGLLVIKAQAYDPKMAYDIASMLLEEGERAMNEISQNTAREQVAFLQKEVEGMGERAIRARMKVIEYQNQKKLIAPQQTAEALSSVINGLEAKLSELKTKRTALLGYLSQSAPGVVDINMQIAAVEKQIESERSRLTAPNGGSLNRMVEEYQRLQLTADMAQDMYKAALVSLERGRIEAMRNVTKMAVLQRPTKPENAEEPRRFFNIIVFTAIVFLLVGIARLLGAIIKEHKD
jgi:capsular polysaccharide transport system permease protein